MAVRLFSYLATYFSRKNILFSADGWLMPEMKMAAIYIYFSLDDSWGLIGVGYDFTDAGRGIYVLMDLLMILGI